jgi:DNA (cytosine-5)-methyltransferase 1
MNYYNEIDEKTAAWLREIIKQGHLPPGDVDTRSIIEVKPNDLKHYTQCHFFAGIGGWPLALALAGWSPDTPVWTGSCPCQPFSTAGKGLGDKDERHLWPVFFDLIRQCRPECVFGEQVASAIGKGWLDGVSADLESEGYACGATVLGAHSVGSPHIRQRLYWVAHTRHLRGRNRPVTSGEARDEVARCSDRVDDSECAGLQGFSEFGSVDPGNGLREGVGQPTSASGDNIRVGDTQCQQHERRGGAGDVGRPPDQEQGEAREWQRGRNADCDSGANDHGLAESNALGWTHGFDRKDDQRAETASECSGNLWFDFQLVACRDGKTRRVPTEPAFFPLAHGIPARVVRLRGYGNAIVPQVAAEFVSAYLQTL